jgi:hypothetical protein
MMPYASLRLGSNQTELRDCPVLMIARPTTQHPPLLRRRDDRGGKLQVFNKDGLGWFG